MPSIRVKPASPRVGEPYTIEGSGFAVPTTRREGNVTTVLDLYVRVAVAYENRAELYKALVASEGHPHFDPGVISLTERAEEPGEMIVTVWDWSQRERLAEKRVTVRG